MVGGSVNNLSTKSDHAQIASERREGGVTVAINRISIYCQILPPLWQLAVNVVQLNTQPNCKHRSFKGGVCVFLS
jgi:hypothetical protein